MSGKASISETMSSKDVLTTTTASSHFIHSASHTAQDFLLIWIDDSIDESNDHYQNTLSQLRSILDDVNIFTQLDEGIDFLSEAYDRKAFLILGGTLGQQVVPLVHDIPQLDSIYFFYENNPVYDDWIKEWVKVKDVHTGIMSICKSLQQIINQYNAHFIAVSFIASGEETSNKSLDQVEPSFMYTQIFKNILLSMEYDSQSVKDFTTFCRIGDYGVSHNIDRFENEYLAKSAIWRYTFLPFTYSMLNYALRSLESETIIKMGFFIHDLHSQIQQLHKVQVDSYHGQSFIVYRGQGLSTTDFDKLKKAKGGLMSFNNFISTSKNEEVSLGFASAAMTQTDMVGILFRMSIDPSVSSVPFASIQDISYFQTEEEVLFSMHAVFRISDINNIYNNSSLYQVDLTLTADDDQQLRTLTEHIRKELVSETGWKRLGLLLLKIGHFDKAQELYSVLLEQARDKNDKAHYYNQLGYIKNNQGDYNEAIEYYKKGLVVEQNLCETSSLSAISYNNIGVAYHNMGEFSKALSFYEKGLDIEQNLHPDHPSLAMPYNNIASVYNSMAEYSKALLFYEKALEIYQKTLPPNHPDLILSYNNIGTVYDNLGEYSKALPLYERALEICHETLLPNHPLWTASHNNIGAVYKNMGEYSKALLFYEKASEIYQNTLPPNHPDLATSYNNIGGIYHRMEEYWTALSFYEQALEIDQSTLRPNHPSLAVPYNNIGLVYYKIGECSKAVLFYEKALEICQKTLPPNHPDLSTFYNNIGEAYENMEEYSKALSSYEQALEICQRARPPNHPDLATSYHNIGSVYYKTEQYPKALSLYEKELETQQKTLPLNHTDLATSYNRIGAVYYNMGEYSKALSYDERALKIFQNSLPRNHRKIETLQTNIEALKESYINI